MGLDYSEKRLVGAPMHSKRHSRHSERLKLYAFMTGVLSMVISIVSVFVEASKGS